VAVIVDGDPVEGGIHLQDEPALALAGRRIGGRVGVLGVGVEAADATLQRVTNFNVHAATTCARRNAGTGREWSKGSNCTGSGSTCSGSAGTCSAECSACTTRACATRARSTSIRSTTTGSACTGSWATTTAANARSTGINALHGDLRAFASVACRINRHLCGDGAGGSLLPVFAAGVWDIDAVIVDRRHIAVALQDGGLDDAVVEDPADAVVGEDNGIVDRDFGDLRQLTGGALCRCAKCQYNCQGKKRGSEDDLCFGHGATFQNE